MAITVDPPTRLPVDHLSKSSIETFMRCPEQWRRRYLERQYEPPSGAMVLGKSAGAAEGQHYSTQIETGEGFTTEQLLDEFDAEWALNLSGEAEINWGKDSAGSMKDAGVGALRLYHQLVVPHVEPTSVERKFELGWEGVDWSVIGYLDLEEANGDVSDLKMRGKRLYQGDADADLQPTMYLAARRAEGKPARKFNFHTMVRTASPKVEVVPTYRSERQLDLLSDRIFSVASEIAWRTENDVWNGAPPSTWFCSRCGYAASCPFYLGPQR